MTDALPMASLTDGSLPIAWQPLTGFQMRACQQGAFEALFGGAAGPGKTSILIALAAKYAQHPSARVIFFRTVYKDTLDIRDRMHALYPKFGAIWSATDSRWKFPAGGTVQIAHARTRADIEDYLGPEYTAVLWDEIALVPEEIVWQMILGRLRSTDPTVPLRARASANPIGIGRGWVRERFVVPCGKDGGTIFRDAESGRTRAYVPGTAQDNPLLPQSYWDGLKDLPPSVMEALRNGDWDLSLGLFYPELLDAGDGIFLGPNEVPPLLDWYEYWGAYDWGFSHPASFGQYVRIGASGLVIKLDTVYLHRAQDEEMAATIRGSSNPRCLKLVYAGADCFARRMAHTATPERVADVFDRYGIMLTQAVLDKAARAKAVRRFLPSTIGPRMKDALTLRFVDTPGNRRCVKELAALVPDPRNPNIPAKRDANEQGLHGDDGADETSFALASPSFDLSEPRPEWRPANVTDGTHGPAPWELAAQGFRMPTEDGSVDLREYRVREGQDELDQQFGAGWG